MEESLALVAIVVALFLLAIIASRHSRPSRRRGRPRVSVGSEIQGKAYVTDGDGLRISGYTIRIAGIDAPEWDQVAETYSGRWVKIGTTVKIALIQEIGGKHVTVYVEGEDRYGRVLGRVERNGRDIGAWLVENGYAIAAYSPRYKHIEREAKRARRGMWNLRSATDPRHWRSVPKIR